MKPQLPSRAPLVVEKLLELFGAAMAGDLAAVEVLDGPHVGDESTLPDDVVIVAEGTPDDPGVTSVLEPQPALGRNSYQEQVEVIVLVSSYSGDEAMQPRRDRVTAILTALKAAVDGNQRVGDVWDQVGLGARMAWYPVQTGQGASCAVGFTVLSKSII